jgi:cobalt/nickel transport system permease protein
MHHIHIDRYAGLSSPVHALDPRAKIVALLAFVFLAVLTPDGRFVSFAGYLLLSFGALAISRVPLRFALVRSAAVLPFALAVGVFVPFITPGTSVWEFHTGFLDARMTAEGLVRFSSLLLKVLVSFFATLTLAATTPFGELMKGAGELGLPSRMVVMLSFMYRALFLIIDETSHMLLARDLRGGGGKALLRASGGIVGALFIRSLGHAETLSDAMTLRGWTGRPVSLRENRIELRDIVIAGGFLTAAAGFFIAGGIFHG